jgi:hypothetical protein
MKIIQTMSIAFPWYRESDWPRWRLIDPDFYSDFNHWVHLAEPAYEALQAKGDRVVKITIDPDKFLDWSRANGGAVDKAARGLYATFRLANSDAYH